MNDENRLTARVEDDGAVVIRSASGIVLTVTAEPLGGVVVEGNAYNSDEALVRSDVPDYALRNPRFPVTLYTLREREA